MERVIMKRESSYVFYFSLENIIFIIKLKEINERYKIIITYFFLINLFINLNKLLPSLPSLFNLKVIA